MVDSCRSCKSNKLREVIDLGYQPPSNAYIKKEELNKPQIFFPLKVFICEKCKLVQIPEYAKAEELFTNDYAYLSSTSETWCKHAKDYVDKYSKSLNLDDKSIIMEIASNDGYLLQYFNEKNIPCFGIEPTKYAANIAQGKGIHTRTEFFTEDYAHKIKKEHKSGIDLIIANNVVAHVPDVNNFMRGIEICLAEDGIATLEFPHLYQLIKNNQFDTIYQEHYSYFSLKSFERVVARANLKIIDVEELNTHGGSLRVIIQKKTTENKIVEIKKLQTIKAKEEDIGLEDVSYECYKQLANKAVDTKIELLEFLINEKKQGKKVAAYGAAAKGNTLLNYAGIKSDLIEAVYDKAESKQGKYLPGSCIPILEADLLDNKEECTIIVLPWNLISEIKKQLKGKKLVTFIPELKII